MQGRHKRNLEMGGREGSVAAPASPPGGYQETGKGGGGIWRVCTFCEKEKNLVGILKCY